MSNISRRDFMKTAGVMTLAVAASGVLAGCSTADTGSEEVKKTSATSATVGDYTISIASTKLVNSLTAGEVGKDDDVAAQYLFVAVTVDEAKSLAAMPGAAVATVLTKNVDTAVAVTKGIGKDVFGKKVALANVKNSATIDLDEAGTYYYAYAVDTGVDGSYKTPEFTIKIADVNKETYITLDATIPTAVVLASSKVDVA